MRKVFEWPKIIESASNKFDLHKIPVYLYDLATLFHSYWSKGNEDEKYKFIKDEKNLYSQWEQSNCFKPKKGGEPYSIMMPPPNVTGSLHMGHALTFTIQDILIRYHRMKGMEVLWQAGTDHAGIATQMVVERKLSESNLDRRSLGREKFIEKVWEWKKESGGQISNQLRRLGASADWSRERFTMDEGLSNAVKKVFVNLFKDGIIYKEIRDW